MTGKLGKGAGVCPTVSGPVSASRDDCSDNVDNEQVDDNDGKVVLVGHLRSARSPPRFRGAF